MPCSARSWLSNQGTSASAKKLLQGLTDPGIARNGKDAAEKLRKWQRRLARGKVLSVATSDAALLLAGLDKLTAGVLNTHTLVAFWCNISRTQHQLDFNPTVGSVTQYARLIQAEMETLALSGVDTDVPGSWEKGPKKPKVEPKVAQTQTARRRCRCDFEMWPKG